jgi:hypothetical protein
MYWTSRSPHADQISLNLPAANYRMSKPDLQVPGLVTRRAKPIRITGVLLYIKIKSDSYKATVTKYGFSSFP